MTRVPAFSLVLAGGRAPACQHSELCRLTSSLDALPRACAWLKPFSAASATVREGPILGACLTELTESVPAPVAPGSQSLGSAPRQCSAAALGTPRHARAESNRSDAKELCASQAP